MSNFLEKLKKGMGIEGSLREEKEIKKEVEGEAEKKEMEKEKPAKSKMKKEKKPREEKPETKEIKTEIKVKEVEIKEEVVPQKAVPKEATPAQPSFTLQNLSEEKGELAVDVYQTQTELVIQSAIAGVKPQDLDISVEKDLLSIGGKRDKIFQEKGDYFLQECYWGKFSREIILPVEVDSGRAEAKMEGGILTIRIPKILRDKKKKIEVNPV